MKLIYALLFTLLFTQAVVFGEEEKDELEGAQRDMVARAVAHFQKCSGDGSGYIIPTSGSGTGSGPGSGTGSGSGPETGTGSGSGSVTGSGNSSGLGGLLSFIINLVISLLSNL